MDLGRTLTDRLHNWARHVRDPWGAEPHGRCGSIEGRASRDVLRGDEEADRRSPSSYPIDHADGELVDRAWRAIDLQHRLLLRYHYVQRRPVGWTMRMLKRRQDAFRHAHVAARYAIALSIDALASARVRSAHSSAPRAAASIPSGGLDAGTDHKAAEG